MAKETAFSKLLTDDRYTFASELGNKYHKDASQILFMYLKLMAEGTQNKSKSLQKSLPEIDKKFQIYLEN
ncbi:hypothetical protein ACVQ8P_05535 [Dellaglioa sp. BT-FLS60]